VAARRNPEKAKVLATLAQISGRVRAIRKQLGEMEADITTAWKLVVQEKPEASPVQRLVAEQLVRVEVGGGTGATSSWRFALVLQFEKGPITLALPPKLGRLLYGLAMDVDTSAEDGIVGYKSQRFLLKHLAGSGFELTPHALDNLLWRLKDCLESALRETGVYGGRELIERSAAGRRFRVRRAAQATLSAVTSRREV
jgi:hypothetical protein